MSLETSVRQTLPALLKGVGRCEVCPIADPLNKNLRVVQQKAVAAALEGLETILFPGCRAHAAIETHSIEAVLTEQLNRIASTMREQIRRTLAYETGCANASDTEKRADALTGRMIEALPEIQRTLQQDILAAYEGDPAAQSAMEVVLSYPCFKAITAHRVAHILYAEGVPLIPRMLSEVAHTQTGIDIHPGARIGEAFFIDHGTGVVIGETCVIGRNVKLYQGVTLGALSFPKDEDGNPIKGIKRHPNVEDDVTIYSGASILGDITIGKGSVIGGNVWLTHSVAPYSKVYNRQPTPLIKQGDGPADAQRPPAG